MLNRWPREGTKTTRITSCPLSERLATKADGNCPHIDPINQFASSSTLSATSKSRKLLKRPRSAEGIDGDDEVLQRKKRRLRLELVTSRLSRPYADPATHIGGTSAWRAGAWSSKSFLRLVICLLRDLLRSWGMPSGIFRSLYLSCDLRYMLEG